MQGKFLKPASIAVFVSAIFVSMPAPAKAANNTGAIVGGLIAGAAIGAVVSGALNHPKPIYPPRPPPPPPPWQQSFQPSAGVWCYPAQRACYRDNGAYAPAWTVKVYGR